MDTLYCANCMHQLPPGQTFCPACGCDTSAHNNMIFGLKPNSKLHNRYIVGKILGQGGFGITYLGFDTLLAVKVAIKEYYPSMIASRDNRRSNSPVWSTSDNSRQEIENGKNSFLREARKMAKVDTIPEIVRIRDMFAENDTAYIIMDYVDGITLKEYISKNGPMNIAKCLSMLEPLMKGLEKVHYAGIIHRDISPDNIMLCPDGSVRLLDLGAAKDIHAVGIDRSHDSRLVAKKGFSPIEQYRSDGQIGPWTDVYSLCATIYFCITGRYVPDAIDRSISDTLSFGSTLKQQLTPSQLATLKAGLAVNSEERIRSIGELIYRMHATASDFSSCNALLIFDYAALLLSSAFMYDIMHSWASRLVLFPFIALFIMSAFAAMVCIYKSKFLIHGILCSASLAGLLVYGTYSTINIPYINIDIFHILYGICIACGAVLSYISALKPIAADARNNPFFTFTDKIPVKLGASLCILASFAAFTFTNISSGKAGDDIVWQFEDGTVTVSGNGVMYDDALANNYFWANGTKLRDKTHALIVEPGAQNIGARAFSSCRNMEYAILPDSVHDINEEAFSNCISLADMDRYESVYESETDVEYEPSDTGHISIPFDINTIGEFAFSGCSMIQNFFITNDLRELDTSAFYKCDNLRDIRFTGTEEEWYSALRITDPNSYSLSSVTIECDDDVEFVMP